MAPRPKSNRHGVATILVYKNESEQTKIEVRQSKESVQKFTGNKIEEKLSSEVKKYIDETPDFLKDFKLTL